MPVSAMTTRPAIDSVPQATGGLSALRKRPWWPWLIRGGSIIFLLAVVTLLVFQARSIEWGKVLTALQTYPVTAAWGAVLLALASFMIYGCFDLLGRSYTKHKLGNGAVLTTAAVSYAITLNFGSLVGSIATRLRLYSRLGLEPGTITRIITLGMLTNWLGYLFLVGVTFALWPPVLPDSWTIDPRILRLGGLAMLAVALAWFALCALLHRRKLYIRQQELELPTGRLAAMQLGLGACNWLVMSGIVYILLQHRVAYPVVVGVLLMAAIAGVILRVPANLGVLEAVFVAMLASKIPQHEILASMVAYRVVYYLGPLVIAAFVYILLELKAKKLAGAALRQPS